MQVSRFNPPLRCVKTLNAKTLYMRRDGQPNLPYSSRAIEVKTRKCWTTSSAITISIYLMTSSVYAIPASSRF